MLRNFRYQIMKKAILVFLLAFLTGAAEAKIDINSAEAGLKADGTTLNTLLIQKAIDKIAAKGGGTFTFLPGCYLSGGIMLRTGVTLHLEDGATLLGSSNPYDYQEARIPRTGREVDLTSKGLLMAVNVENVGLSGKGTIDGQGLALSLFVDSLHHTGEVIDPNYNIRRNRPSGYMRPNLLCFHGCKGVVIRDLDMRSSAGWGLSFDNCEYMELKNLKIENRAYWNNDGIDLGDCRHVLIDSCDVNAADDGICLKSNVAELCCYDVEIAHCKVRSSASAIKMGTASWGGFRRVNIHDIKVRDTFRSAIAIESVDGGIIDSISVENVHALNTGNAMFLRLGSRAGERKGILRNVTVRNLYVEIPFGRPDEKYDLRGPEVDFFHNPFPSPICGLPGQCIENVTIENVEMVCPGRATKGMAYMPLWRIGDVPEQASNYLYYIQ